jgi:hypothetical protein
MKKVAVVVIVGLALAVSASAAASVPSTVFYDGYSDTTSNGQGFAFGHVETSKLECLSGRKVDVYFSWGDSSFGRVDRAVSGGNGAFAGTGPASDFSGGLVDAVKFKLKKRTYGRSGHRKTCAGDTTVTTIP